MSFVFFGGSNMDQTIDWGAETDSTETIITSAKPFTVILFFCFFFFYKLHHTLILDNKKELRRISKQISSLKQFLIQ